ncbi:hypothetical protein RND71_005398 [Anisodus tanguticus]|uniref:Uncharacterized protein n=1 Tax=Anisodus tanguticus TaxID=243964 RepID=A0AAE1SU33_9SOLA|nr:hypothetical protein RND71_005398 [Anisodus tanguticus]
MSEGSINSTESRNAIKCHCGLNDLNLTAWTDSNAGRRLYKCSRPKVERNKLKKIVDGMNADERYNMRNIVDEMEAISIERDNLRKKLEEMDFVNIQEAAEISILEEKVEEMEFISAQEVGRVVILEKNIKKLKAIIFISWALFLVFLVGMKK